MKNKNDLRKTLPLSNFGIFIEGFHKRIELKEDLEKLNLIMKRNDWRALQYAPDDALIWQDKVVIITDVQQQIVFATENMINMNGYRPNEVIGKTPKMFQGEATTLEQRHVIKQAIVECKPFNANIINYKKDGTIYNCNIEGYPVYNTQGLHVNFVAYEKTVE